MDTIIGQGRITANSVIVYNSLFSKAFGRKNIKLSFSDDDAYPFGRFPIMRLNQEIQFKFYIGNNGSTHGSLLQMANDENRKTLGTDWLHNPQYQNFTAMFKIQSAGRIWINRKIIVMRDERPEPNIVNYVMMQLFNNGISDIMTYNLLYMDDNNRIHKCTMDDYIKGCADSFGYKTHENLPSSHQNKNEKMPQFHNKEEKKSITQAEYNFYRKYGLGDDIKPRFVNLNEAKYIHSISEKLSRMILEKIKRNIKR